VEKYCTEFLSVKFNLQLTDVFCAVEEYKEHRAKQKNDKQSIIQ